MTPVATARMAAWYATEWVNHLETESSQYSIHTSIIILILWEIRVVDRLSVNPRSMYNFYMAKYMELEFDSPYLH